jgi:hypothetical protein
MNIDQFGYSPDIGSYVKRNGKIYTEYGAVYSDSFLIRSALCSSISENYADWTEEHRAEVKAAFEKKWEEEKNKKDVEKASHQKLIEQAKTKLTEDEFWAVMHNDYYE